MISDKRSITEKKIDAIKYADPRTQLETLNRLQNAGFISTIIGPEHTVSVLIASPAGKKLKTITIGQKGFCGREVDHE